MKKLIIAIALFVAGVAAQAGSFQSGNLYQPIIYGKLIQQQAGQTRQINPVNVGKIYEYADVVAATTGNIEIGISFNCPLDVASGTWLGRDVAGVCWLEKWLDDGQSKQIWFAPSAAAGVVPTWSSTVTIGAGGNIIVGNGLFRSYDIHQSWVRAYVTTAALAAYTTPAGISKINITSPAAAITVTLPAPTGPWDGVQLHYTFGAATTVTWVVTAPATATAGLKTTFAAGESYTLIYNATAGSPAGSPATTWIPY